MAELNIYRNEVVVATVNIDEKTVLQTRLMNEDVISAEFVTTGVLPIALGDYVTHAGKNYWLNTLPNIVKRNNKTFKYTAIFQSQLYDLNQKLLISSDGLSDFTYAADPLLALTLIVENLNQIYTGWTVGDVDEEDVQVLRFTNDTCRTALSKIADVFAFEFEVVGKTIHFKKAVGTVREITFEYGRNKGLYEIERRQVQNKNVFTRVYGFGGTKNIPFTYRDRAKRLVFEERYLEKNVPIYGIKEGHFTDDNIYPQRTATLTAVNTVFTTEGAFNVEESYVEDTTLDFDINDYLLEGTVAKIVFKSGALSGYQFEIYRYEHDTKRIYFNPFIEGDGFVLPSEASTPEVGDKYTLVDIEMPGIYIIEAEQALKNATQRYLDENCVPKVVYLVKIDPQYAKANTISLNAGDLVEVVDTQLGIDRSIRISQISFPLVNPYKMTAVIADFIPFSLQQLTNISLGRVANNVQNIINQITNISNQNITNNTTNNQTINNFEYPEENVVIINGRKFRFAKAPYNIINPGILEFGDIIYGNYWDNATYVVQWRFLGGEKNLRSNYSELNTIDTSSPIARSVLQRLRISGMLGEIAPQEIVTIDASGGLAKTPIQLINSLQKVSESGNTTTLPLAHADAQLPNESVTLGQMQQAIDAIAANLPNGLISGGIVAYTGTDFDFEVSTAIIREDSIVLTVPADVFTLSAADATHPRKDIIVVSSAGFEVLEGTPAASPTEPQPTGNQIRLTAIDIPAASSAPGIDIINVYLDNNEWAVSHIGDGTSNPDETTFIYSGTKAVDVSGVLGGSATLFTAPADVNFVDVGNVFFRLHLKQALSNTEALVMYFLDATDAVIAKAVPPINKALTEAYQLIAFSANVIDGDTSGVFRKIKLAFSSTTIAPRDGYYIDQFVLQSGLAYPVPVFNQVQTDWEETDPASPAYLVNKPESLGGSGNRQILLDISNDVFMVPSTGHNTAKEYIIPANTLKENTLYEMKFKMNRLTGSGNPFSSVLITNSSPITHAVLCNGAASNSFTRHFYFKDGKVRVFKTSGGYYDDLDAPTTGLSFGNVDDSPDLTIDNVLSLRFNFSTANTDEFMLVFFSITEYAKPVLP